MMGIGMITVVCTACKGVGLIADPKIMNAANSEKNIAPQKTNEQEQKNNFVECAETKNEIKKNEVQSEEINFEKHLTETENKISENKKSVKPKRALEGL